MKDEIKLKDMTDFLENVYKDIKKQPTLEEELEKERKFINKIKDDNEDEIKINKEMGEIIIGNTKFYGIAPELLDYIINLQEENENLKDFNNKLQATKDRLDKYDRKNQLKIDKAVEYINEKADYPISYYHCLKELRNILQGEDNE